MCDDLPTKAATYWRPTGLLKNPTTMAADRGGAPAPPLLVRGGCDGGGNGGGDFGCGRAPSAAAASHSVGDDANAYGSVRFPRDKSKICNGKY